MSDAILVKSAFPDELQAKSVARILLEKHLVSAVQIKPIDSLYWWQDHQFEEKEWEATFFSTRDLFQDITKVIEEHHSYELPEVIALKISDIPEKYYSWIKQYTKRV